MNFFDGYIQFKKEMFLGKQGIEIDEPMFKAYVEKYGEQSAIGYLHAVSDFNAHAEVMLGGGYCRNGIPESGHMVRKFLREFVDHNKEFLKSHQPNPNSNLTL